MGADGIFDGADRFVFHEGFGRVAGALVGDAADELAPRLIKGSSGAEIGRVDVRKRSLGKKALDLVMGSMGSAIGAGRIYEIDLRGVGGRAVLFLRLQLGQLDVMSPDEEPLGEVRMASRINDDRLRVEMRAPRKRKFIDFSQGGPVLAGIEEKPLDVTAVTPQTYSWTVCDPQGGELARIVREAGEPVNRLELEGGLDTATRTLTIAFAAALFDRWWLQIPTDPGGGG